MFLKNVCARIVNLNSFSVAPGEVAEIEVEETHKGVVQALKKGWLQKTDEKEYLAFSDPKAAAELAKSNAEKSGSGKGGK